MTPSAVRAFRIINAILLAAAIGGCRHSQPPKGAPTAALGVEGATRDIAIPIHGRVHLPRGEYRNELLQPPRIVVRDEPSWRALWPRLAVGPTSSAPDTLPLPTVAFEREMVLIASLGARRSLGDGIAIDSVYAASGRLVVVVREETVDADCLGASASTAPVDVVIVPRDDRPVTFVENRVIVPDCGVPGSTQPPHGEQRSDTTVGQAAAVLYVDGRDTTASLYYHFGSGVDDELRLVVRDSATWASTWAKLSRGRAASPVVDFRHEAVVVAALGGRSEIADWVTIDSVRAVSDQLIVTVITFRLSDRCGAASQITAPAHAVRIRVPKGTRRIVFVERTVPVRICSARGFRHPPS